MKAACGALRAIHQLIAGFTGGDAISNEALVLRALFRSWGYDSHIFSEARCISPVLRNEARDIALLLSTVRSEDIALLHLSIGSIVNDCFASLPCRKAILYHNMTPADYFRGIQEPIARDLTWGHKQAQALTGTAEVIMAVSHYNAAELRAMGYGEVRILPLLLNFDQIRSRSDRTVLRTFRDGKANILFVGRCVPNKRIEDILSAFYYFQRFVEPNSRFIHVGSYTGLEKYQMFLQAMAHDLGLQNVLFTGAVAQDALNAYYACASLFLCMSEHEGFCIPLIESMAHDVPILAYAAAAVPETLEGAGVLFRQKRWDLIAEMMGTMLRNRSLREGIIANQRCRLARYEARHLENELKACLSPLL